MSMRRVKLTVLLVACLLIHAAAVRAEDITVMTSGAFTDAYLKLSVPFAHDTQHKIITAVTTMGVGAESILSRIARGETVDVVIVAAEALDALIKDGRVLAGSRVDLARSSIGMAVRAGAPKPDISSVEALTRTLVNAKSIAYSASVSGDYLAGELFQRLGIVDQMKGKATRIERERVGAVVARGDAELGFQQISELMPVPGIDLVGPLPPAVQRVTIFAAGIAASSQHVTAARAFIAFLASPQSLPIVLATGLEAPRSEITQPR